MTRIIFRSAEQKHRLPQGCGVAVCRTNFCRTGQNLCRLAPWHAV